MHETSVKLQALRATHSKVWLHLLCFFLFGVGCVEPRLPNGSTYMAGVTGIFALVCGTILFWQRKKISRLSIADVIFVLYIGYTLINLHGTFELGYFIKAISLTCVWWCVRQFPEMPWRLVAVWAVMSGVLQTIIGVLQWCGILASNHTAFAATGMFNNPGGWGGYLAIMLAFSMSTVLEMRGKERGYMLVGCAVIVVGLVLSNSRAAWLAVVMASIVLLTQQLSRNFKKHVVVGALVLLPFFVGGLYLLRPASAEARWLIWQVSAKMFTLSPMRGLGTGGFAAKYMTTQADYLSTAPTEVQRMADDNLLAFNEILLVLCEQVVVGLLLLSTLIYFLFRALFKSTLKENRVQWLLPFTAMFIFSLFSYFSCIWGLLVFLLFVAAGVPAPSIANFRFRLSSLAIALLGNCLLVFGLFSIYRAQTWIKLYANLQCDAPTSPSMDKIIRHDAYLSTVICEAAWLTEDDHTLFRYTPILENYKPTAQWKIRIGERYEAMEQRQQALSYYRAAHRMMPGLTLPLYAQFSLWRKANRHNCAKRLARQVMNHTPKISNERTSQMKQNAQRYLSAHE